MGVGHLLPHSRDVTSKHKHFYFTPIFFEVVVLIPFDPANLATAKAPAYYVYIKTTELRYCSN